MKPALTEEKHRLRAGRRLKGYLFIAVAASLWGISATVAKMLFNRAIDPLIIVQTRVSIAFIVLLIYFGAARREVLRISLRDVPLFFYVGICGLAGSNYFYYAAIKESNVATSILVQYTAPVMVALYATVVQREAMTKFKAAALLFSMTGIVLAVGGYDPNLLRGSLKGIANAFAAAVSFSIFNIAGKPLTMKYSVWTTLIYVLGAATVFWLFVNSPAAIVHAHYSPDNWLVFTLVSTISILLPYIFYFSGLRFIEPTRAIITSTLEPVVAIVSAFLVLGGAMSFIQIVGVVFVLAAIGLLQVKPRDESRVIVMGAE
ncbi:MAG: EamA family transporter [Bacteroidota bacterium]|nr:EamA family transporter [Bacteroidota bacterium]